MKKFLVLIAVVIVVLSGVSYANSYTEYNCRTDYTYLNNSPVYNTVVKVKDYGWKFSLPHQDSGFLKTARTSKNEKISISQDGSDRYIRADQFNRLEFVHINKEMSVRLYECMK